MKISKFIIGLFILSTFAINAQSVDFSGQVRPRWEFNNKDFNSNTDGYTYTFLRTRVNAKYTPSENVSGFVQLQDSRIFGTEGGTMANTANVDIHQAFFTAKNLFGLPFALKAGRMEVKYGNERFLGAVGWSNTARSFDGAMIKYQSSKFSVDIFALQETEKLFKGDSLDQSVFGAYFNIPMGKASVQPFFVYQNESKTEQLGRSTVGLYTKGSMAGFFHEIEAAYQTGKFAGKDVSAYMFAANVGYKFDMKLNPSLSLGYEYLSGDDGKDANKYKVFNTLYATNHKFYGYMDYFINIPRDTYGLGLVDMHAKVGASFSKKVKGGVNFHVFNSAEDYTLVNGSTSNAFGNEIDITVKYLFDKYATFVAGFSMFSPGEIFKEKKSKDSASWGYLMAVINL